MTLFFMDEIGGFLLTDIVIIRKLLLFKMKTSHSLFKITIYI